MKPSNKLLKNIKKLLWAAKTVDGMHFKICAGILDKSRIYSFVTNSLKTHSLAKDTRVQSRHAEMGLVAVVGEDIYQYDILVVRWRVSGPGMAKPCLHCEKLLRNMGVRRVFYTTSQSWEDFAINPKIGKVIYAPTFTT